MTPSMASHDVMRQPPAAHHVSSPPASYRTCTLVLSVGPPSCGPSSLREAIPEVWRALLRISTAHARPAPELHSARAVDITTAAPSACISSPNTLAVTVNWCARERAALLAICVLTVLHRLPREPTAHFTLITMAPHGITPKSPTYYST
jgi:hypothetical protein